MVKITENYFVWRPVCYNSDMCLAGGILNISLLGKSSRVAGFCKSANGLPWIFAANEENW